MWVGGYSRTFGGMGGYDLGPDLGGVGLGLGSGLGLGLGLSNVLVLLGFRIYVGAS